MEAERSPGLLPFGEENKCSNDLLGPTDVLARTFPGATGRTTDLGLQLGCATSRRCAYWVAKEQHLDRSRPASAGFLVYCLDDSENAVGFSGVFWGSLRLHSSSLGWLGVHADGVFFGCCSLGI